MKNLFWLLLAGAGIYFVYKGNQPTLEQMKDRLRQSDIDVSLKNALTVMLPDEIVSLYRYVQDYFSKGLLAPAGSSLSQMIQYIVKKYYLP